MNPRGLYSYRRRRHARYRVESLRADGIVSQDTVLFNDTVRNNIAYGATVFRRTGGARARGEAHQFIAALPKATRFLASAAPAVGRPASASGNRPRAAHRSADSHPRRGDLRSRYGVERLVQAIDRRRRPNSVRHRAPALDDHMPISSWCSTTVGSSSGDTELLAARGALSVTLPAVPRRASSAIV
jgi:hypothetical protein